MDENQNRYRFIFNSILIVLGVLLLLYVLSCRPSAPKDSAQIEAEQEISMAWKSFLNALEQRNTEKLKNLSLPYILCPECMYRSENYKNDLIKSFEIDKYVEAEVFYSKEFDLEFPPKFVAHLKDLEPSYANMSAEEFSSINSMFKEDLKATDEVWIVILLTTPPKIFSPFYEGGQHLFPFIKTATGLKFGGITSVP